MKKILSGDISATAAQPFKQGTWIHLQEGIAESLDALAKQVIGSSYDPTKVYILYGCVNSTTPPIYTVTAGAVFYDGEIYLVPAFSFTAADTAAGAIDVSYFAAANADPVEFTDGINHNVHAIRRILVTDTATAGDLDYDNWIIRGQSYSASTTGVSILSPSGSTINALKRRWNNSGDTITLSFNLSFTAGATSIVSIIIPLGINGFQYNDEFSTAIVSSASSQAIAAIKRDNSLATDLQILTIANVTSGTTYSVTGQLTYQRG